MAKQKEIKTNAMRMLEQMDIPFTHLTYECREFADGIQVALYAPTWTGIMKAATSTYIS